MDDLTLKRLADLAELHASGNKSEMIRRLVNQQPVAVTLPVQEQEQEIAR